MAFSWTARTVGSLFADRAKSMGERPFLHPTDGGTLSYAELWRRGVAAAAMLQNLGVGHGDPVVIMAPNGAASVIAALGVALLGAVDVSINTAYVGATFDHALRQVNARHLIICDEYISVLASQSEAVRALDAVVVVVRGGAGESTDLMGVPGMALFDFDVEMAKAAACPIDLPAVSPQDIACIIYTSGSTGSAKGVMMPHAQVMLIAEQTVRHMALTADDVFYSVHPLYHMAGKFMLLLACAEAGGQIYLDRMLKPEKWLDRIRETDATFTGAHGAMLEMIAQQPATEHDRDHRLRTICAAPFPRHIARDFEARFGVRGVEVWGMTEVGIPIWTRPDEPLRPGCCGKVDRSFFEFAIVDPETDEPVPVGEAGEFVVRNQHGWTMMQGYAGQAEATVSAWRNLWFHTGDTGYMDEDGYIYFLDRADDRIRRRAENISASDIEIAISGYSGVREAVAVGFPSEFANDDDIRLFVQMEPGQPFDPAGILQYLIGRLPYFMVPRYVEHIDELPRSVTHKIQRRQLRERPLGPQSWDRNVNGVRLLKIKEKS
ncbi:AMP-binding protein [Sphingobium yanoikuyae]|uniref:AMP-binding protein n=1 Tax=Sphingobium yanoikuyae TaxID=13690 RepID=A0A9X7YAL9_SPHYA|nr:AMP-binding protein [Sphingobium yanoikuyae]QNG43464.1 AMP-binding protein [Sphingobium yanoikuyae]